MDMAAGQARARMVVEVAEKRRLEHAWQQRHQHDVVRLLCPSVPSRTFFLLPEPLPSTNCCLQLLRIEGAAHAVIDADLSHDAAGLMRAQVTSRPVGQPVNRSASESVSQSVNHSVIRPVRQ